MPCLPHALFSPMPCLPHSFNFLFRTYDAEKSDAKTSATPEAPQNDTVQGSPNQGTESR